MDLKQLTSTALSGSMSPEEYQVMLTSYVAEGKTSGSEQKEVSNQLY